MTDLGSDREKLHEHDAMQCRSCGNEERASEGYPCASCGTFLCVMCEFKGVTLCAVCRGDAPVGDRTIDVGDSDAMIQRLLEQMPDQGDRSES